MLELCIEGSWSELLVWIYFIFGSEKGLWVDCSVLMYGAEITVNDVLGPTKPVALINYDHEGSVLKRAVDNEVKDSEFNTSTSCDRIRLTMMSDQGFIISHFCKLKPQDPTSKLSPVS